MATVSARVPSPSPRSTLACVSFPFATSRSRSPSASTSAAVTCSAPAPRTGRRTPRSDLTGEGRPDPLVIEYAAGTLVAEVAGDACP
jgi:hypothetical protein